MSSRPANAKREDPAPKNKVILLQYSQMKGVKKGKQRPVWKIEQDRHEIEMETQVCKELTKTYKIALVDPKTKQIRWMDSVLMDVRAKLPAEEQAQVTSQVWDVNYKKRLAEEFGTSKSKRKINQMLSNTISN